MEMAGRACEWSVALDASFVASKPGVKSPQPHATYFAIRRGGWRRMVIIGVDRRVFAIAWVAVRRPCV